MSIQGIIVTLITCGVIGLPASSAATIVITVVLCDILSGFIVRLLR
jgi:hypothetical protein